MRSWEIKKPSLKLQNTCTLASISFPKQSERECLDFETLLRNLDRDALLEQLDILVVLLNLGKAFL